MIARARAVAHGNAYTTYATLKRDAEFVCCENMAGDMSATVTEDEGSRCPSGCVATATAQIMYYYKWPSEITMPIPAHSWTYNDQTYTLDELPPMTIEWSRMRNSYSGSATSEKVMSTFT